MTEKEVQRSFYPSGKLRGETTYIDGVLSGETLMWHENGGLAMRIPVEGGMSHGLIEQWNERGELLGSFSVERGTGCFRQWHENGVLKSEMYLISKIPNGRQRVWDEVGDLLVEKFYLRGLRVSWKKYQAACAENPDLPVYDRPAAKMALRVSHPKQCDTASEGEILQLELFINNLLRSSNSKEALEWLHAVKPGTMRNLGEGLSQEDSIALVEEIYALGALRVLAVGIDSYEDGCQNSEELVVQLPSGKRKRRALFDWYTEQVRTGGFDAETDIGQDRLYIKLS